MITSRRVDNHKVVISSRVHRRTNRNTATHRNNQTSKTAPSRANQHKDGNRKVHISIIRINTKSRHFTLMMTYPFESN